MAIIRANFGGTNVFTKLVKRPIVRPSSPLFVVYLLLSFYLRSVFETCNGYSKLALGGGGGGGGEGGEFLTQFLDFLSHFLKNGVKKAQLPHLKSSYTSGKSILDFYLHKLLHFLFCRNNYGLRKS